MAATQSPDPSHRRAKPAGIPGWFKSSYSSGASACVAVRRQSGYSAIADTKNFGTDGSAYRVGPVLLIADRHWPELVVALSRHCPGDVGDVLVRVDGDGTVELRARGEEAALVFNGDEVEAFLKAVEGGQFNDLPG